MTGFGSGPIVVKLGGRTFEDATARRRLAGDIAWLSRAGAHPIVVHGGGARITAELAATGMEARFVRGLRITGPDVMAVVERVLTLLGKELAQEITDAGAPALSLTGRDAGLLRGEAKDRELGRVGDVVGVNSSAIRRLTDLFVPVIAPVAVDRDGPLNVNADEAAAAVARALQARALILMTDVDGVLDPDDQLLPHLAAAEARGLIASGVAKGGMIPKIEGALATLAAGVGAVHIVNGATETVLRDLAEGRAAGTTFVP
ncbi:MAG TPA: acetylglutamate kinase [Candidatus Thermoplasmatota archaeon]|nr:acetylglutamate kinase [Candidatus Thermoplasmatota archaeon]